MSRKRHPFRSRERDTRCDPVIEWYLNVHGVDSGFECRDIFPSHDAADDVRLSLRRAGNHYGVSVPAWVTDQAGESCWEDCQDPDASHVTHFRVYSKGRARAYMVDQAGPSGDIANWRYNPFFRGEARREQRRGR